jgi:hypothetical protein
LDRTVAEPVLDEPCVMTRIGQGITAGVAQHVSSMDPERQLGALANGFHEAFDGVRRRSPFSAWIGLVTKAELDGYQVKGTRIEPMTHLPSQRR